MAWYPFGRTSSDWAFVANVDGITPNFVPGAVLTAWSASTGGTQLDMSLDGGSSTVASITASDGTDGLVPGTVPEHWVAFPSYWIDGAAGAGPRTKMVSSDAADLAVAAKLEADNQQDQITNNSALLDIVMLTNVADSITGLYDPRPAIAGPRVVAWIGPSTPTAGGDGSADGDLYFDSAP